MTGFLPNRALLALAVVALASFALLAGCIDSPAPILSDAHPLLGERVRLQFYVLHDGAADEPAAETFAWQGGRYVRISDNGTGIADFTLHDFEGADLIVQSIRPGLPTEYAIARKLADGTYLLFAVDEGDADEAMRNNTCGTDFRVGCRVTTREEVLAFARTTAAKPHSTGGLALLMAAH
jgi:hypothetical protein